MMYHSYPDIEEGGEGFYLVLMILFFFFMGLFIYLSNPSKGYDSNEDACKEFYGQEYSYVEGDRSPDLCVTQSGEVKYYSLIEEKK